MQQNRREFLAEVGRGMLIAGIGPALAADLGLARAPAQEAAQRLTFGKLEPLVGLMQDTPADNLLPLLREQMRQGADLRQLTAAGALANARTFGGEDYIGFHTMMALAPAFRMGRRLPPEQRPLPVFKVLHRNTRRMQEKGGSKNEVLHPVQAATLPEERAPGEVLLDAVRRKDLPAAEATFAGVAAQSPQAAFNELLHAVQDGQEVHRIVLPYRAWDLLDIIGKEHAHTMLRQSVHYCVRQESPRYSGYFAKARALLPKLLDQYKLVGRQLGYKPAADAWVEQLSQTIFKGPPEQAAEAVAAALAEGFDPEVIGEAISLAANQLVLRDNGRPANQTDTNKPAGSVHGDGIGVHACDSANAWRNMARVSNARNTVACLVLGAYQACMDGRDRGGEFQKWEPYPRADARERCKARTLDEALAELHGAIKAKDQPLASAAALRVNELGGAAETVFQLLLSYSISEDGALHAEKFYRTTCEEFAATRLAFRWRQVIALARVTASAYGYPAPGYAQACQLLQG
jgi:hypothetical protein